MTVDILVILRATKKMLDKVEKGKLNETIINVENARDMLDELIKQLEVKPIPIQADTELDPEAQAAKEAIL